MPRRPTLGRGRFEWRLNKLALETETDRLSGIYVRVAMQANVQQANVQQTDVVTAGRDVVAKDLVAAVDWDLVREAIGR